MKLRILGSNSSGNAYLLEGLKETLLLECGVHHKQIMQAVGFDLDPIVGCIVTHNHGDHFKWADGIAAYGIEIYGSHGTIKDKIGGKYGHRYNTVKAGVPFSVGGFSIYPFDVIHDADEPLGFIIQHEEAGKILFITDSSYSQYTFKGINHAIVEANHSEEYLRQQVLSGKMEYFVYKRLIDSHMSIETCEKMLLANNLTDVINIVLIHLSDSNSHEQNFKKVITEKTGKLVTVAQRGVDVNLSLSPF